MLIGDGTVFDVSGCRKRWNSWHCKNLPPSGLSNHINKYDICVEIIYGQTDILNIAILKQLKYSK